MRMFFFFKKRYFAALYGDKGKRIRNNGCNGNEHNLVNDHHDTNAHIHAYETNEATRTKAQKRKGMSIFSTVPITEDHLSQK